MTLTHQLIESASFFDTKIKNYASLIIPRQGKFHSNLKDLLVKFIALIRIHFVCYDNTRALEFFIHAFLYIQMACPLQFMN